MRLGLNRRIRIRIFPAHSMPFFNNVSKMLVFFLVLTTFSMGAAYYYAKICPLISGLAKQLCTQKITEIVNAVILEEIENCDFEYEDFVTVQKSSDGKIQAMSMNTKQINKAKSSIAIKLQQKIASADSAQIKLPLGTILEGFLFADSGPIINISLVPVGYALVDFENSFSDAGINQTKHQLDISVSADFGMIMSFERESISIKTTIPVAQTIIVGDVPEAFVNFRQAQNE